MRYYETIYIVDPNLENTILEKTMTEIGRELEKTKAKIINHRDWGKKRLAYQVAKQKYGSFILLQFGIDDLSKIKDFDQWLKLNSLVLRHMTVSLDQKPKKHTEKSAAIENPKTEDTESLSKNNGTKTESDVEESSDSDNIQKDKEA